MMIRMETTPRFERERITARGIRTRNLKLIALGQVDEHRSIRYGKEQVHVRQG